MASLRWIAGFACLLSILAIAIAEQQSTQDDSENNPSESTTTTALESLPRSSPPANSTRVVSLRIYEKSDSGTRVIACPSVHANPGQSFSILAGPMSGDDSLEDGYSIEAAVGECSEGTLQISLLIANRQSSKQQDTVQQAQSQRLQYNLQVEVPGSKTIKLSQGQECEIIVR